MQTKQVLEKIVKRFQPFVVTTSGGYSVSIQSVNHLLAGKASIVIMDSDGFFEFIPIEQVTRISTKEGDVLLEAPTSLLESLGRPLPDSCESSEHCLRTGTSRVSPKAITIKYPVYNILATS
jgi:hypothetical protein